MAVKSAKLQYFIEWIAILFIGVERYAMAGGGHCGSTMGKYLGLIDASWVFRQPILQGVAVQELSR